MSGRKQHYIPQFMLRPFGELSKGKKHQIRVSSRNGVFIAATDGAAAERNFYSKLDSDRETLDDVITRAEGEYSAIISMLLNSSDGIKVDSRTIAKVITHLGIRGNYVRQSFATFGSYAINSVTDLLSNPEYFRNIFGIGRREPPPFLRKKFDEFFNERRNLFREINMSRHEARQFAFAQLNQRWEEMFEINKKEGAILSSMFNFGEMASDAHNKSLAETIEPEARVEILENLEWKLFDFDDKCLSLPDCIALAHDTEFGIFPATFVGNVEINSVIFPISPSRAVCGGDFSQNSALKYLSHNFSTVSAICSWDFVITPPSYPETWVPTERIGEALIGMMSKKMEEAIAENMAKALVE